MKKVIFIILSLIQFSCSTDILKPNGNNIEKMKIDKTKSSLTVSSGALSGAIISVDKHIRGHKASFSECSDANASTNYQSGELLMTKYNLGCTMFDVSFSAAKNDEYNFGRIEYGDYLHNNYSTVNPQVTQIRNSIAPTCLSYGGGTTSYASTLKPNLLVGRNSNLDTTSNNYEPGYTDDQMINRPSTFRWEWFTVTASASFFMGPTSQGRAIMDNLIPAIIRRGGWYNQFSHFAYFLQDYQIPYYTRLDSLLQGQDVYKGSYSSIGEYYWVRESVDSITVNNDSINVYYNKRYLSSPYNKIITPLWLKIDLSSTSLSGQDIVVSNGMKIRSIGNDIYHIPVMLDYSKNSQTVTISTGTPNYFDFSIPTITRTGQNVTSSKPIKLSVWLKAKTKPYIIQATLSERKLTPATSFTLTKTINTTTNDYYLGWITEDGISGVIQF